MARALTAHDILEPDDPLVHLVGGMENLEPFVELANQFRDLQTQNERTETTLLPTLLSQVAQFLNSDNHNGLENATQIIQERIEDMQVQSLSEVPENQTYADLVSIKATPVITPVIPVITPMVGLFMLSLSAGIAFWYNYWK